MKRKGLFLALVCWMSTMNVEAQVGAYDRAIPLPTMDLYDTQTMNMALANARMAAQLEAKRQEVFSIYANLAIENYNDRHWWPTINCVNRALETTYYNADMYYIRGYAYEQLGYYREAKKDYKKAKKYGNIYAEDALETLKIKMKKK